LVAQTSEARHLKPGRHTIKWTLLEAKDAPSRDRYINIAGFEIFRDQK
jgi:hypothetical protein